MSDRHLPPPENEPANRPEEPDHAAVMKACAAFIIEHGLSAIYPPESMSAPDHLNIVRLNLLPAPPEAPDTQIANYHHLVRTIVNRLTPDDRERIILESYQYRNKTPDTENATTQFQAVEKARGMLLIEHELTSRAQQLD